MTATFYFVDVEKVFNRVEWDFIKKMVQNRKLEESFLKLINLMYGLQHIMVWLKGISPNIYIQCVVKAGFPLSPLNNFLI